MPSSRRVARSPSQARAALGARLAPAALVAALGATALAGAACSTATHVIGQAGGAPGSGTGGAAAGTGGGSPDGSGIGSGGSTDSTSTGGITGSGGPSAGAGGAAGSTNAANGGQGGIAGGAAGGATATSSVDYAFCDSAMNAVDYVFYRVDRASGTCIILYASDQITAPCRASPMTGLMMDRLCMVASLGDPAACDKHTVKMGSVAATSVTGSFSLAYVAASMMSGVTLDLTVTFPSGTAPETAHLQTDACPATCTVHACSPPGG